MDRTKDEREKRKRSRYDNPSKGGGEPGGEDPSSHPFDREVHPADESARPPSSRKRTKGKP